jgi:hypothetical protein
MTGKLRVELADETLPDAEMARGVSPEEAIQKSDEALTLPWYFK